MISDTLTACYYRQILSWLALKAGAAPGGHFLQPKQDSYRVWQGVYEWLWQLSKQMIVRIQYDITLCTGLRNNAIVH